MDLTTGSQRNNAGQVTRTPDFIRNGDPVGPLKGYSCQLVVDEQSIGWINSVIRISRFLSVWFHEPHAPIAPQTITRKYGELRDRAAVYSGTIDNTDQAIGRLLTRLAEIDDPGNTIVIYASDNGGYRRIARVDCVGGKNELGGGLRVSGIFSWPSKIQPDQVCHEPAGVVDLLPTSVV